MKFIIKPFSEIMIKSKPVRKKTLAMLQKNIHLRINKISKNLMVHLYYDNIEVNIIDFSLERDFEITDIKRALSRIPGIEIFIEVDFFETNNFATIVKKVSETYIDQIKDKTFCVRVKRYWKHDFTSTELERYIWEWLLKKLNEIWIKGRVQMRKPEVTVALEVRGSNLYVVKSTQQGIGWYPVGMQDRVISLISGGFDSGVSTYSMMKRGCKVDFLFFNLWGSAHELWVKQVAYYLNNQFSSGYNARIMTIPFEAVVKELVTNIGHKYRAIILKRCMLKVADQLAQAHKYYAIVKGDSLGQVSSQTLKNMFVIDKASQTLILRPLIGFNKQEIIDITKMIGTYDFACNMPEYCGVISDRPSTWACLDKVLKEEAMFDSELLTQAIKNKKVEKVWDIIDQVQWESDDIEYKNFPIDDDVIIDVREPYTVKKSPLEIKGREVIQIPFYDVNNKFKNLDQSKNYILYCDKGVMSKLYWLYLIEKGFKNVAVYKPLEAVCGKKKDN